jgi:alanine racemase
MAYIELSKAALFHNLDIIAQKTEDKDKIALVLKDNAYGHGLVEIATMAQEYGITRAVVRNEDEANTIKTLFPYILILAPRFNAAVESNFVYTINTEDDLNKCTHAHRIELKVDTGMHRNGILVDEVDGVLAKIRERSLPLEGVFTHYRSADAMSGEWFWQKKCFENIKKRCNGLRVHSNNSAALFREAECSEDMVRVGIAAYGCLEMDKGFEAHKALRPVLSLVAEKLSQRSLKKGEGVGYNATFHAVEDCVVSNYDIGYADGFNRTLSNCYQTPQGHQLLGRVSMDNTSYATDVEPLLVFEDARKVAALTDTIAYEVLTSLSPFIPRHVVD